MGLRGPKPKIPPHPALRNAIREHEVPLPKGHEVHLVPTVQCLAEQFGVSLATVRNAFRRDGWTHSIVMLVTRPKDGDPE